MEIVAQQIARIEPFINSHRAAQQAGALRPTFDSLHWFKRSQQDRRTVSFLFRDHVHAMMHPVDQVNISMAGRPKHDTGPFSEPLGRMRREIVRPKICLHFHNPPDALYSSDLTNEQLPKKIAGNQNRGPVVK